MREDRSERERALFPGHCGKHAARGLSMMDSRRQSFFRPITPPVEVGGHDEHLAEMQRTMRTTRDRDLLKRSGITHGCYVRALRSELQLREVFRSTRPRLARRSRSRAV